MVLTENTFLKISEEWDEICVNKRVYISNLKVTSTIPMFTTISGGCTKVDCCVMDSFCMSG